MKIDKERKRFLKQELKEYEKTTPMMEEGRSVLREWVRAGNSVHENGASACYGGGCPIEFLDVYREEEESRTALASMTYEQGSRYLSEKYGIDRDAVPEPKPTYEELRKKASHLYRTCMLYWEVLIANDLREEACEYVREHIDEELPFDPIEWDIAQ
ncbi:hypothetical protein QMP26_19465 [Enterocloster clostridioformis]